MDKNITDFSKHLLVTVFAIFAFTSAPLLGASSDWVKISYGISLTFAIIGMHFCHGAHLAIINDYQDRRDTTNIKKSRPLRLSDEAIRKLKLNTQWQYYCTQLSMISLAISIAIFLCTDNPLSIKVEQGASFIQTQAPPME